MATPVLYVLAGPNGAGKTTYYEKILKPATNLPFINADVIARDRWPQDPSRHAYEAARDAAAQRLRKMEQRSSFITETVFSHPSKLELLSAAQQEGYRLHLKIVLIPEQLAVARVRVRVETGGHDVPEDKIRERYRRLWRLMPRAIELADEAEVLDNSSARTPFRRVASYLYGGVVETDWPTWTPRELLQASASK